MATRPRTVTHDDRRASPRDEVYLRTTLLLPGGGPARCEVVNLSTGGVMARLDALVSPGDHLALRLPSLGERVARVVWALGGRLGAEWLEPIDSLSYAGLIRTLPRER